MLISCTIRMILFWIEFSSHSIIILGAKIVLLERFMIRESVLVIMLVVEDV